MSFWSDHSHLIFPLLSWMINTRVIFLTHDWDLETLTEPLSCFSTTHGGSSWSWWLELLSYIGQHRGQSFPLRRRMQSLEQAAVSICSTAHEVLSQHHCDSPSLSHSFRRAAPVPGSMPTAREEGKRKARASGSCPFVWEKQKLFPNPQPWPAAEFHLDMLPRKRGWEREREQLIILVPQPRQAGELVLIVDAWLLFGLGGCS